MKAIVLTYDRYKIFADHMISSYFRLWPDNPFTFVIPYQYSETKKYFEERYGSRIEMVLTPKDIVGTMRTLLNNIDDEEWIYWSMDDRYLMWINKEEVNKTYNWLCGLNDPTIAAVKCTSHLWGQSPENINYFKNRIKNEFGQAFYQRKNYVMIWIHQFLRAKVLKDLFKHIPSDLTMAKHMDFIVNELTIPSKYKLYSNKHSLMVLGESTSLGKITKNCYQSLLENGYDIPDDFQILNEQIFSGDKKNTAEKIFFYTKRLLRYLLEPIGFRSFFRARDIKYNRVRNN